MKKASVGYLFFIMLLISCSNKKSIPADAKTDTIFPKGEKVVNSNFTGTVWLHNLTMADSTSDISVGNVTFAPGARSKWHIHPAGQILLVTAGKGFCQEKGGKKKVLRKGDVIKCLPDVPHWHGASADSAFVQLAITSRAKGPTKWLGAVTDKEYYAIPENDE